MALNNALDVSRLLAFAATYAPDIIKSLLNEFEIKNHFPLDTSVSASKRYPKMRINGVLGPYTGNDDSDGNEIELSDRELTVEVGQAVIWIDPETVRRTFLGQNSRITDGEIPAEEAFITYYLEKIFEQFSNETFYKGDKTLAATAPNKSKRMMNGLELDLLNAISNSLIAPVTTAAWNSGSGRGVTYVEGNTISGFANVWEGLKAPYRKNASNIFAGEGPFKKYVEEHNRAFSQKIEYLDGSKSSFYMDGTSEKALITKAYWLGSSNRILAVNKGAIQVGTDKPDMISELDIQKRGFKYGYLSKFVGGVRIIDPEGVSCNSLS